MLCRLGHGLRRTQSWGGRSEAKNDDERRRNPLCLAPSALLNKSAGADIRTAKASQVL
jgi:hypothetical protein